MLLGFFSSAQCVPVAARVEQLKKFMWMTTCISSGVFENKNYKYVFRPQASGDQFGLMTMDFIAQNAQAKFGKEPKDLRVAIIHEDGAYGVDVAKGNVAGAKKAGFNLVLKEGYSATAPDLSALVTKLKRAQPDVIFHTGYNPDITLLLRQAREQGLKFGALVGHGAGYGVYEKLKEGLGSDVNYIYNTDPISIWLANQKSMDPKLPPVIKTVGEEFDKLKPGVAIRSAHVGIAASNTYVFLADVLPRAIKKYGGVDPDALRKASLDTDIPEGGTMLGFGVKFYGEGTPMAGQNERSFRVDEGEILGLIGPNGSGKSTIFNMLSGTFRPTSGSMKFAGSDISGLPPHQIINGGIGRTFQIPRPFHRLTIFENVALAGYFGQGRHSRSKAEDAAERALAMVGLSIDRAAEVDGLGAAGLKKLELAKALATGPKLLLADESLGGLDETEMDQAAEMLRKIRDELGITIIWVEHIMGVLMRVVDRVMVLDHGEKISEGLPSQVSNDPRVVEVYLGTDAVATQAAAAEARR